MNPDHTLNLLLSANQLKRVPRTGWVMRGVPEAESVADHSYGVAFIALTLADRVDQPLDEAKVLALALLHDLPESVMSDLPSPAAAHLPPGAKGAAESSVLEALLNRSPHAAQWQMWWQEFEEGTTAEARLVRDADRLDMLIQAYVYERSTGNQNLGEFWDGVEATSFAFAASRRMFDALQARRERDTRT